jgi:hypothetical protein
LIPVLTAILPWMGRKPRFWPELTLAPVKRQVRRP